MARWRHQFIYNGPREGRESFGVWFPRGEKVSVALDKWNSGVQREAERAGLKYLGLVDCLETPPEVPEPESAAMPAPEPALESKTTITIKKKGRGYRGSY